MSIQNIGRNLWRVVVKKKNPKPDESAYHDRRFRGTKAEAQAFEYRLKGPGNTPGNLLFGTYIDDVWLPSLTVTQSTVEDYRLGISYLDMLWPLSFSSLSAKHIEEAIHSLPEGNRRKRAKRALSVALSAAVRWGYLDYSPLIAAKIKYGKGGERREYEAYSADELLAALTAFRGHPGEAVVIVMSCGGLRREEALALDWGDINLDSGEIQIYKAWTFDGNRPVLRQSTKTDVDREVWISGYALDRLCELALDSSLPLWPGVAERYIRPSSAYMSFKRKLADTGMRYIPLNHLRHTYATLSLANGIDVGLVSDALGHAQVSTTVDKYVKPLKQARRTAAAAFADALWADSQEISKIASIS